MHIVLPLTALIHAKLLSFDLIHVRGKDSGGMPQLLQQLLPEAAASTLMLWPFLFLQIYITTCYINMIVTLILKEISRVCSSQIYASSAKKKKNPTKLYTRLQLLPIVRIEARVEPRRKVSLNSRQHS